MSHQPAIYAKFNDSPLKISTAKLRQSLFRGEIKDIAISLKAYKIAIQEQEGWQSLVYCNGLEIQKLPIHYLTHLIKSTFY